ncbi:unnamed protein product [Chrysoparadoxa australica]
MESARVRSAEALVAEQYSSGPPAGGKLRRGKWTAEEEAYASKLIEEFKIGQLPLTDGTTLRAFLSIMLNCDPMRISKKFVGPNCIGKQVFRRRGPEADKRTQEEIDRSGEELVELELKFLQRVKQTGRGRREGRGRKSGKSHAAAAATAAKGPRAAAILMPGWDQGRGRGRGRGLGKWRATTKAWQQGLASDESSSDGEYKDGEEEYEEDEEDEYEREKPVPSPRGPGRPRKLAKRQASAPPAGGNGKQGGYKKSRSMGVGYQPSSQLHQQHQGWASGQPRGHSLGNAPSMNSSGSDSMPGGGVFIDDLPHVQSVNNLSNSAINGSPSMQDLALLLGLNTGPRSSHHNLQQLASMHQQQMQQQQQQGNMNMAGRIAIPPFMRNAYQPHASSSAPLMSQSQRDSPSSSHSQSHSQSHHGRRLDQSHGTNHFGYQQQPQQHQQQRQQQEQQQQQQQSNAAASAMPSTSASGGETSASGKSYGPPADIVAGLKEAGCPINKVESLKRIPSEFFSNLVQSTSSEDFLTLLIEHDPPPENQQQLGLAMYEQCLQNSASQLGSASASGSASGSRNGQGVAGDGDNRSSASQGDGVSDLLSLGTSRETSSDSLGATSAAAVTASREITASSQLLQLNQPQVQQQQQQQQQQLQRQELRGQV